MILYILSPMEYISSTSKWNQFEHKTILWMAVWLLVKVVCKVEAGEFLYLAYPSSDRPNNTVAQAICAAQGNFELAIIDSQSEYDRMLAYLDNTLGTGFVLPAAFWIGAYWVDVGGNWTHFWQVCDKSVALTWALWDSGEPNGPGSETCTRIHTNLFMRTIQCSYTYDIMCEEKDPKTSGCSGSDGVLECKLFASCWWTPAKIGLLAGFTSIFLFFCCGCIGWRCFCAPTNEVGNEYNVDDEDEDDNDESKNGHQTARPHNIMKNYNVEKSTIIPSAAPAKINSRILGNTDTSWMSPEELSFSARYGYKD